MPDKSKSARFGDLYAEPSRNGLTKPSKLRGQGVKLVNMGEIFAHDRLSEPYCERTPCTEKELNSSLLRSKDLLFARQSLVLSGAGKCSLFIGDSEPVVFESHIIRVRLDQQKVAPEYYYYYFRSPTGRAQIESIVEQGAGASGIRGSDLAELLVPRPPLEEQQAIAYILGTLDDKIETNHRGNEALEAMARALFKDWFVDFGPVRAKLEGRRPYLASGLWSLFPDEMSDDELPGGWLCEPLSSFIELIGGGTPKTSEPEYWGGDIPWFSVVDAPSSSDVFVMRTQKHITAQGLASCSTRLLPELATIISARGTVGRLALVGQSMAMNQSCYAAVGADNWGSYFVYFMLKEAAQRLQANTHGSVFDTITRKTFESVSSVRPSPEIGAAFESLVAPWLERIKANNSESETLTALRDTLLPKLLSGELRVRDAEKLAGGAL